MRYINLLT